MVITFNHVQSINNMLYLEGSPTQNIRVVWELTFSKISDEYIYPMVLIFFLNELFFVKCIIMV